VAVAVGPAGSAVGQSSPPLQASIQVSSPATLVARGAGVDVLVTIQCSAGTLGNINLNLTERVGSDVATGFGGASGVDCTNATQTLQLLVTPGGGFGNTNNKAFKRGTAIAQASIEACTPDFSECVDSSTDSTISIK